MDKADEANGGENPPLTPQEMEALSIRYVVSAIVVPLKDGSFAVFANDRSGESLVIVQNTDDLALAITSRANMAQRKTPSRVPGAVVDLDALFDEED
jgi:hypothetical protein